METHSKAIREKQGVFKRMANFIFSQKAFDRRRHPRIDVYPPFFCVLMYSYSGSNEEGKSLSELINISRGGAMVVTDKNRVYPGTKVQMVFKLPSFNDTLIIDAEVVRTHQIHGHDWFCSGLKFEDTEQAAIHVLIDFILKQKGKAKDQLKEQFAPGKRAGV